MIGASFCGKCRAAHPPGEHTDRRVVASVGSAPPSESDRPGHQVTAAPQPGSDRSGQPPQNLATGDGVIWTKRAQEGHAEFLDGRRATPTFNPGCECCQERRRQNAAHQRAFKARVRKKKQ